jgi:hypothetical protein
MPREMALPMLYVCDVVCQRKQKHTDDFFFCFFFPQQLCVFLVTCHTYLFIVCVVQLANSFVTATSITLYRLVAHTCGGFVTGSFSQISVCVCVCMCFWLLLFFRACIQSNPYEGCIRCVPLFFITNIYISHKMQQEQPVCPECQGSKDKWATPEGYRSFINHKAYHKRKADDLFCERQTKLRASLAAEAALRPIKRFRINLKFEDARIAVQAPEWLKRRDPIQLPITCTFTDINNESSMPNFSCVPAPHNSVKNKRNIP